MKDQNRKCLKCGSSPADDPSVKLFRFPQPELWNPLRCELWAKYCFPDKNVTRDFQIKLYTEHRMLCHKHFTPSSFSDFEAKKLHRHAVPEDEVKRVTVNIPSMIPGTSTTVASAEQKAGPSLEPTVSPPIQPIAGSSAGPSNRMWESNMNKRVLDEETSSLSVPLHLTPQIRLNEEKTLKVSISPAESDIDEDVTLSELSNNCDKLSQNKDLIDQTIPKTSSLPHEMFHDDPYIKFGLHVGNELRKYDAKTLAYVKSAICEVIHEADKIFMKQGLD